VTRINIEQVPSTYKAKFVIVDWSGMLTPIFRYVMVKEWVKQ